MTIMILVIAACQVLEVQRPISHRPPFGGALSLIRCLWKRKAWKNLPSRWTQVGRSVLLLAVASAPTSLFLLPCISSRDEMRKY